jgi:ethanolamine transporter
MIASLANNIPMFGMMKDMDDKGKIINVAFAVSASFVFGDHLGFVAGVAKNMIFPMIIGKLVAGISAVVVAVFIANKMLEKEA